MDQSSISSITTYNLIPGRQEVNISGTAEQLLGITRERITRIAQLCPAYESCLLLQPCLPAAQSIITQPISAASTIQLWNTLMSSNQNLLSRATQIIVNPQNRDGQCDPREITQCDQYQQNLLRNTLLLLLRQEELGLPENISTAASAYMPTDQPHIILFKIWAPPLHERTMHFASTPCINPFSTNDLSPDLGTPPLHEQNPLTEHTATMINALMRYIKLNDIFHNLMRELKNKFPATAIQCLYLATLVTPRHVHSSGTQNPMPVDPIIRLSSIFLHTNRSASELLAQLQSQQNANNPLIILEAKLNVIVTLNLDQELLFIINTIFPHLTNEHFSPAEVWALFYSICTLENRSYNCLTLVSQVIVYIITRFEQSNAQIPQENYTKYQSLAEIINPKTKIPQLLEIVTKKLNTQQTLPQTSSGNTTVVDPHTKTGQTNMPAPQTTVTKQKLQNPPIKQKDAIKPSIGKLNFFLKHKWMFVGVIIALIVVPRILPHIQSTRLPELPLSPLQAKNTADIESIITGASVAEIQADSGTFKLFTDPALNAQTVATYKEQLENELPKHFNESTHALVFPNGASLTNNKKRIDIQKGTVILLPNASALNQFKARLGTNAQYIELTLNITNPNSSGTVKLQPMGK